MGNTVYSPSYCSTYSSGFSNNPHHIDSLCWRPISLPGNPPGNESKRLQASPLSLMWSTHIWRMRNTQTSFVLMAVTADPSIPTLLYSSAKTSHWPISPTPRICKMLSQTPPYLSKSRGHISNSLSSAIEASLTRLEGTWESITVALSKTPHEIISFKIFF